MATLLNKVEAAPAGPSIVTPTASRQESPIKMAQVGSIGRPGSGVVRGRCALAGASARRGYL